MIGRTLAHYRVLSAIGAGGMGEVYRATDTKLGRDVAIKVLPAEMAVDPGRLERFQREARALAALDHPGIVSVFSVEEAEGVHFLTMQLIEGESLDRIIASGGLLLSRFFEIAVPLAEALSAAHERRALAELENLTKKSLRGSVTAFNLAIVHLGLGDRGRALDYLEQAYAADTQWLGWLKNDRTFDPLRSEPRFAALMKKLHFDR